MKISIICLARELRSLCTPSQRPTFEALFMGIQLFKNNPEVHII